MNKRISEREARRLRRRVEELERQEEIRLRRWTSEFPGGVHLVSLQLTPECAAAVNTAIKLGHYVVVKTSENTNAYLYASRAGK